MNGPRLGCRLIPQVASAFEGARDLENYRALLFFLLFFCFRAAALVVQSLNLNWRGDGWLLTEMNDGYLGNLIAQ